MSLHAITTVLWHSKHGGTTKLVLLALADVADDQGESCYPSLETIAKKACCSVRRAQEILRTLQGEGTIEIRDEAGPRGTNAYSLRTWLRYVTLTAEKASSGPPPDSKPEKKPATGGPAQGEGCEDCGGAKIAGGGMEQGAFLLPEGAKSGRNLASRGVRNSGAIPHPNSQEQSYNDQERESGAVAPALALEEVVGAETVWRGPGALPAEWAAVGPLVAAAEAWRAHLDGVGRKWSRQAWEAMWAEAEFSGGGQWRQVVVRVIDFSIAKSAKNLLWQEPAAKRWRPRTLRLPAAAGVEGARPGSSGSIQPVLLAWLEKEFGANAAKMWEQATEAARSSLRERYARESRTRRKVA